MEFRNSTISVSPQFSPAFSFLTWKNTKTASRLYLPTSRKFPLCPSYSLYPFCSVPSTKSPISARFGRPTNRQNHLRKKLTHQQQQQQQQQVRQIQHPVRKFDKVDNLELNFGCSSEKIAGIEKKHDYESKIDSFSEGSVSLENGSLSVCLNDSENVKESETESRKNKIGESVMWNKLESWVEQYKKDSEFWGMGVGHIFTIHQNSEGKVERVVVNEDEITRRSRVVTQLDEETKDFTEVNCKISLAKKLAKEMENGSNVIPKNSSVAKFLQSGRESRFTELIRGVTSKPGLLPRTTGVGFVVLCGLCVIWASRAVFAIGRNKKEYTTFEKEMLRRKTKARKIKDKMTKGSVEIMEAPIEPKSVSFKSPRLDNEELVNSILKAKELNNDSGIMEYGGFRNEEFKDKIEDIQAMARRAREKERGNSLSDDGDKEDYRATKDLSSHTVSPENVLHKDYDDISEKEFRNIPNVTENSTDDEPSDRKLVRKSSDLNEANRKPDGPGCRSVPREKSSMKKLRIIKSAEEARDYLSRKNDKLEVDPKHDIVNANINKGSDRTSQIVDLQDFVHPEEEKKMNKLDDLKKSKMPSDEYEASTVSDSTSTEADCYSKDTKNSKIMDKNKVADEFEDKSTRLAPSTNEENWLEKNYHEFEPIVEKIGVGFRENYGVAREKASQESELKIELSQLVGEDELEWMRDEKLREIVFRVRDNELSGRDPFVNMDEGDKRAFFIGLEKKVKQENEKLLNLHEYLHSNIENLDYGADGISLYDPPEKIIPRWKVPPVETNPEFLNNFVEQRKALFSESLKNSIHSKKNEKKDTLHRSDIAKRSRDSKIIIQGSDGSVKAGKKSGKEFWQHTKRWSEGFLQSYNAETDPEIKAVMRDMGKDLDRWITEKEIQEAADFMNKIPETGQKLIRKKLDKVKREMELFGPQAVVSKYREYTEEKEKDYLWWLDLPSVMCIELYTTENGEQRFGFYSLEMAADLELDPKQYHVVAFENAGECKNLCYIIQAHMEMLGNGNAFVVARPPKDAFREAKANGFSVTVIRKGQLQLNIDQTLEEVEESIAEIGSKIYHDKVTKEHSVNINGLMKGVFGVSNSAKGKRKRSRRKLKRRVKQ